MGGHNGVLVQKDLFVVYTFADGWACVLPRCAPIYGHLVRDVLVDRGGAIDLPLAVAMFRPGSGTLLHQVDSGRVLNPPSRYRLLQEGYRSGFRFAYVQGLMSPRDHECARDLRAFRGLSTFRDRTSKGAHVVQQRVTARHDPAQRCDPVLHLAAPRAQPTDAPTGAQHGLVRYHPGRV